MSAIQYEITNDYAMVYGGEPDNLGISQINLPHKKIPFDHISRIFISIYL